MAEVAEAEGGAAEVFESAVDRLCRAVRGAGSVEVAEDIAGALLQRASKFSHLDKACGNAVADPVDRVLQEEPSQAAVLLPVCGDHVLVDAPRGENFDVPLVREQRVEPGLLFLGEEPGAGEQGVAGLVERVTLHAPAAEDVVLDAAAAVLQCVTGEFVIDEASLALGEDRRVRSTPRHT